jgi:phage-related protein
MKKQMQEPKEWKIMFYETESGRCPINDFMNTLVEEDREDMIQKIEELKIIGNNIRRPKGNYLRDKIYELRITLANNNIRTLYFFVSKLI